MPQHPRYKILRRYQRPQDLDRGSYRFSSKNAKRSWVTFLLGIALLSAGGVVASSVWLSYGLFFNPNAIASLNEFLPPWAQLTLTQEPAQTLTEIAAELSKKGKIAGKPLPLEINSNNSQPTSVLLPVKSQNQIVELRVYRIVDARDLLNRPKGEIYYQFITQADVTGPEESFVVAPLVNPETADTSSNRPLSVTELRRFDSTTPTQGIWFYLWGQRQRGQAIAYGYIVHYNPDRSYLSLILPWTSPTSQPQWQQVIAGGSPELVIDQSVDLEPRLQVYQVKPANFIFDPLQLEPVSIAEPALNSRDYQNALLIARSGLWTPAEKWLQFIKQRQSQAWSSTAQAQLDFIRLHAEKSQKQANQTWASPSQQALTSLIDGRWGEALKVFQASPTNTQEIATLLETDNGKIGNRVEVALRVNPKRTEVKAWGALLKSAKEKRRSAIAWLKQQPQTTSVDIAYIQKLLKRLEGDFSSNKIATSHSSRFVGTAQQVTQINPTQWLQIEQTPLQITDQQTWYQIQLSAYHDGNTWQQAPFKLTLPQTAAQFWQQLGLNSDAEVQIVTWLPGGYQQIDLAVVKAVQLQEGSTLKLLAVSHTFPIVSASRQLALTKATSQWLQPETIAFSELTQQSQPIEVAQILPQLWQELQKRSPNSQKTPAPNVETMLKQLGELPVQLIDLDGDGTTEVIMIISPQEIAAVHNFEANLLQQNNWRSRTIIFSHTGRVLYSEFSNTTEQRVIGIADFEDDQPPALLVATDKSYQLKRWSTQHQSFD
jgi:hypothetical protein